MENFIWGFLTATILTFLILTGVTKIFWDYITKDEERMFKEKQEAKEKSINEIRITGEHNGTKR